MVVREAVGTDQKVPFSQVPGTGTVPRPWRDTVLPVPCPSALGRLIGFADNRLGFLWSLYPRGTPSPKGQALGSPQEGWQSQLDQIRRMPGEGSREDEGHANMQGLCCPSRLSVPWHSSPAEAEADSSPGSDRCAVPTQGGRKI